MVYSLTYVSGQIYTYIIDILMVLLSPLEIF